MNVDTELIQRLENNVIDYYTLKQQVDALEKKQNILKADNLMLMQELRLKTQTFGQLKIDLIEPIKKIGVDEGRLIQLVGIEKVNMLRVVPVVAVEGAIKGKILPKEAGTCIIVEDADPYTKITVVKA